jgi:hypothetical protein
MDCGSLNTVLKILKQAAPPMQIPLMPEYVISRIIAKVSFRVVSTELKLKSRDFVVKTFWSFNR